MLRRFRVPVLAVVENMSTFRCDGCGRDHSPFGRGHVEAVLASIGRQEWGAVAQEEEQPQQPPRQQPVAAFHLPIVVADSAAPDPPSEPLAPPASPSSPLDDVLGELAESLERSTADGASAVSLPQLAWHERPNWPDKLFFGSRGTSRAQSSDCNFRISPPAF